jgi:hypothetical protein
MMLSQMFVDQEAETFEQRRDEVVSIISAATDLAGAERGLRPFVEHLCAAADEHEFDDAFVQLVDRLSGSFLVASGAG